MIKREYPYGEMKREYPYGEMLFARFDLVPQGVENSGVEAFEVGLHAY